jgi:hypothetical protein
VDSNAVESLNEHLETDKSQDKGKPLGQIDQSLQ